jgi:STAS-like domain of unknown function (DUF4325)
VWFLIKKVVQNETTLAGAESGRRLFAKLVAAAPEPTEPEPAFLDFSGIRVATSSFLRESVVAFRDYARKTLPNLYPVIANAENAVAEEFAFFLRHREDAFWVCDLDKRGRPTNARLLGQLDEVQRATFDRVLKLGSASAPALAAQSGGEAGIGPTAWNNRLANLASRGLLIERRGGKTKTFAPVLEMM